MEKKKPALSRRTSSNILTGCVIVVVYLLLKNLPAVRAFIGKAYSLISPFVGGLVIAYLLGLLMSGLERLFLHRLKPKKLMRTVSLFLSFLIALLVIAGLLFAIIPAFVRSVSSLVIKAEAFLTESESVIREYAGHFGIDERIVSAVFGQWDEVIGMVTDWTKQAWPDLLNTTINIGSTIGNGIVKSIISIFIAIYVLADKERLGRHARLVIRALTPTAEKYDLTISVIRRSHKIFSGFITGKLLDSLIIGVLCFIGMLILRLPNALLISGIVGVTNIIPTFGPVIGAIPSAFFILIESPIKALYFLIFILVLQQLDGNVIGPRILGNSTGLSALWVLISICFFGSLWGVVGMLVGVPIVAIVYVFAAEAVQANLLKKGYGLDNRPLEEAPNDIPAQSEDANHGKTGM